MRHVERMRAPGWPGDPATLTAKEVDFEALAHVLGNTCCWGGRSRRFYSLAQRAVTVSGAVEQLGGMTAEDRRVLCLYALLSDAGQAWVGCMAEARPVGKASEARLRDAAAVQRTVLEAAGVEPELPGSWSQALELTQRMAEAAVSRDLADAGIALGAQDSGPQFPPLKERVRPWPPDRAAKRWLERFEALRGPGGQHAPGGVQSPGGVQERPDAARGEANDGRAP